MNFTNGNSQLLLRCQDSKLPRNAMLAKKVCMQTKNSMLLVDFITSKEKFSHPLSLNRRLKDMQFS